MGCLDMHKLEHLEINLEHLGVCFDKLEDRFGKVFIDAFDEDNGNFIFTIDEHGFAHSIDGKTIGNTVEAIKNYLLGISNGGE